MRLALQSAPACLAAILLATLAVAAPAPAPPPVRAVRASEPIVIDGSLNESVWKVDNAVPGLLQADPQQGQPESERTEIRVVYDDDAIYIGARLYDEKADSIVARLGRRDNTSGSDAFAVCLDTFRDRRTGYYFGLSAAGTPIDGTLMNDGWDDDSWDGVWNGRVRRDEQGWTAEMRIPFSQLRFNGGDSMIWGINFSRTISRRNEEDKLVYTPRGESGFVSRFPELVGLDGIRPVRKIEVLPYTTGKAEYLVHDTGDPFHDGSRYTPAMGADLRTNVGPKLTLNATVNPDFGQVEIDPAVVNLSDVESFFQEKRPFFTEGLSVFRCGNNGASDYWGFNWPEPTFFYTRRIGHAPGGSVPGDVRYTDMPLATRILGAAKITGQPRPGFNFGTLHALTQKEDADFELSDGTRGSSAVEPLTYYGVLRGMRSFNKERQGLGVMTLETARAFDGTGLRDAFNGNGLVTAVDGWTALDPKKDWVLSGYVAGSRVDGTPARITSLQENSRHYYQRPDRGDLGVDPNATSLQGYVARAWVNHEKGPWLSNSAIGVISPGFENNDLGFSSRTDVINTHAGLGYNWNKPNKWKKQFYVIGAVAQGWNFAGQHTMNQLFLEANLEQMNAWSWQLSGGWMPRTLNDRFTRGGPTIVNVPGAWSNFYWDNNGKSKLYFWASVNPNFDQAGSYEYPLSAGATWKPSSSLSFTLGPNYDMNHQDVAYVTQTTDAFATNTYGGRYVFASLDQKTVGAELRMDCSLTPTLSIQMYAQPLISSGRYTRYRELARGGTYDFVTYGRDNGSTIDLANETADPDGAGPAPAIDLGHPDFTFRTVRGNLVVRWEYLPGSTAYVVWTQDRSGDTGDGRFNLRPTLSELSRTPANNVFMVKIAHHFEL
jgi:hypothetical protein